MVEFTDVFLFQLAFLSFDLSHEKKQNRAIFHWILVG